MFACRLSQELDALVKHALRIERNYVAKYGVDSLEYSDDKYHEFSNAWPSCLLRKRE